MTISTKKWNAADVKKDMEIFNSKFDPDARLMLKKNSETIQLHLNKIRMEDLINTVKKFKTCKKLGKKIIDEIESITVQRISKIFNKTNTKLPEKYVDKILCADSLKQLKKIPDNCIDFIFTSPPYNFGLEYENTGDDSEKWKEYFGKLFDIFTECIRVLKHGGRIAINIQPLFSDYIPAHHIISNYFTKQGLIWKGEILWEKNNYNCKYTAWGSWKSPSSPYLKYTWEFVEVFCKGDLKKEGDKSNADILGDDFKKWVYAKWSISPERKMKEYDHPAMFPEELVKRVLQLFSFKNDVILDPFVGAGTTCVVAKKTGRHYVGIDVSKEYTKTSINRLKSILS